MKLDITNVEAPEWAIKDDVENGQKVIVALRSVAEKAGDYEINFHTDNRADADKQIKHMKAELEISTGNFKVIGFRAEQDMTPKGNPVKVQFTISKRVLRKVERDGKIAVLFSPEFGGGWNDDKIEALTFDPFVVDCVLEGRDRKDIVAHCQLEYGINETGHDGSGISSTVSALEVQWIKKGDWFYIHCYDGNEWIITAESEKVYTA